MADLRDEIVFICTANTCRSPMSAGLFRDAVEAQPEPLRSLKVSSAGVSVFDRQPANPNSIRAMAKVGVDIQDHRSQGLSSSMAESALAFFGMTDSHLALLSLQIEPAPSNLFLMREFIGEGASIAIPDPFGMDLSAYEACRDSMVEAIPSLIRVVEKLYEAQLDSRSDDR
ncbi:MAG: low molecular weight protein arginine phosphatase [Opitutales bacterium]|nr:low molecular weight protein arginine phosphatase [Opitutales bacterium]